MSMIETTRGGQCSSEEGATAAPEGAPSSLVIHASLDPAQAAFSFKHIPSPCSSSSLNLLGRAAWLDPDRAQVAVAAAVGVEGKEALGLHLFDDHLPLLNPITPVGILRGLQATGRVNRVNKECPSIPVLRPSLLQLPTVSLLHFLVSTFVLAAIALRSRWTMSLWRSISKRSELSGVHTMLLEKKGFFAWKVSREGVLRR